MLIAKLSITALLRAASAAAPVAKAFGYAPVNTLAPALEPTHTPLREVVAWAQVAEEAEMLRL